MQITEEYECLGAEYAQWTCQICGYTMSTFSGGEPCCCPNCLDGELLEEEA